MKIDLSSHAPVVMFIVFGTQAAELEKFSDIGTGTKRGLYGMSDDYINYVP